MSDLKNINNLNDVITNKGSEKEVISSISHLFENPLNGYSILDFIKLNSWILEDDEYVSKKSAISDIPEGFMGLMINDNQYHINLRASTLMITALLLDINLSKGFASLILSLTGNSFQTFNKISPSQRCLITEIVKKKFIDENYFSKISECCNNHIICNLKDENNICKYNPDIALNDLNDLLSKKILTKSSLGYKVTM